ncbi:PQQ-dependent dehydrogenase, methanol/ethanol family, partial [Leclercia adecarboxylata]|nr:PQQ-dependent dehydrogenase, methanol/ethanol family [Leclercia adecarboxylata]
MKHTGLRKPFALTALCAAVAMSSLHAWAVTDQEILDDAKSTHQIVTNGLGLQGQRYSTLDTLNTNNINQLRPVWGFSLGGEKQRGQEAQPLIKDGVM